MSRRSSVGMEDLVVALDVFDLCATRDAKMETTLRFAPESLPARYARVARHPANAIRGLARAELGQVARLVPEEDWAELQHDQAWPVYEDEYVAELRAKAGRSMREVVLEVARLREQVGVVAVPSATELPFTRDLSSLFIGTAFLATEWTRQRDPAQRGGAKDEPDATEAALNYFAQRWDTHTDLASAIGEHHELLATTRAEDGQDLGLTDRPHPDQGWLAWLRQANRAAEDRAAALAPPPGTVLPPHPAPPDPPGLTGPRSPADSRYGYAATLIAAFEGAPLDGVDELRRYYRPYLHQRFHQAYDLAAEDLRRLLDDATTHPELLAQVLGAAGLSPRERLMSLLDRLDPYAGWPAVPLADLPMNRWEVRFRFPELADLCAHPVGGLREASEAFVARREPCRVLLPPIIGEIRELLALLPHDQDLAYAMAHLGRPEQAERATLLEIAEELTAHIWQHADDNPDLTRTS